MNSDLNQQTGARFVHRCVLFGRDLRSAGIPVTPAQLLVFLRCLSYIDLTDRTTFRAAACAALVCRREQLAIFDAVFDRFWATAPTLPPRSTRVVSEDQRAAPLWALDLAGAGDIDPDAERQPDRANTYSAIERLRHRDFGVLDGQELAAVRALLQQFVWRLPLRRRRRLTNARRGEHVDLRRTLRASLRHGGVPLQLLQRTRAQQRRPVVLLCDVSGSMERYARILLQFIFVAAQHDTRVEAFTFSTRLTRITRQLRSGRIDQALDAAVRATPDWGGGTRIGPALRTFNQEWSRRVLGRGALVLIVSDGCERGDPALLAQEMARLHRSCHRLLWLNPWLGQPGYAPRVRGLQAALPHVDRVLPVHNLASLEQLAKAIESL